MKVQVLQEDFKGALISCSRLTLSKVQLPILQNVFLKTQKNKLLLCTTNLELSISLTVGAKVIEEGDITVPAKAISEIISNIGTGPIDLETEKEVLKISLENFEARLVGLNSSEFPAVPSELGLKSLSLKSEDVLDALNSTLFAVSLDETRPQLTGVLIILKEGKVTFVSTDGFRLSQKSIKGKIESETERLIVPKSAMVELLRLTDKTENINLSFNKKEKQVMFGLSNTVLSSRIIEGNFPEFEKIIPRDTKFRIEVDKDEMLRAVKLASVFAKDSANVVKFYLREDEIEVFAESSQMGMQKSKVAIKSSGEKPPPEFLVAFNYRFLEDFLNIVKGDSVRIEILDPHAPVLFLDTKDEDFLHIIMPIRLGS